MTKTFPKPNRKGAAADKQKCPSCGSTRWERIGDVERCIDCGR